MANGIRTGDPRGFNKGRSLKFREGSRVRQTPEEGWRIYRPKRCGNRYEDNSPKTLNDKNRQASSQKFRQLKQKMWFEQEGAIFTLSGRPLKLAVAISHLLKVISINAQRRHG